MSSNILALIDAVISGTIVTLLYFYYTGVPIIENLIYVVPMTIAVWVGSMVGYDKVIQTVKQISG